MFNRLLIVIAALGFVAAGCGGGDAVTTGAADANVGLFAKEQANSLRPVLKQYRTSYKEAIAPASLKRCNAALERGDTGCFEDLLGELDTAVAALEAETPAGRKLSEVCRSGLKRWLKTVAPYQRFSDRLHRDFASDNYNRITRAMQKYSLLVDYNDLLRDKALPALQESCMPDDIRKLN